MGSPGVAPYPLLTTHVGMMGAHDLSEITDLQSGTIPLLRAAFRMTVSPAVDVGMVISMTLISFFGITYTSPHMTFKWPDFLIKA